ncbi:hypothetical protein AMTR_s00010p00181620 [Amborella trichopoda]|uniref:Uncharacterized protein n=1 Tax=Amborella trichopoda TaxID=13333 RepID=W1NFG3_AMBTC|nr:hypothetical protein AMTR_s00010p00181620 [Amborella trichopoda]
MSMLKTEKIFFSIRVLVEVLIPEQVPYRLWLEPYGLFFSIPVSWVKASPHPSCHVEDLGIAGSRPRYPVQQATEEWTMVTRGRRLRNPRAYKDYKQPPRFAPWQMDMVNARSFAGGPRVEYSNIERQTSIETHPARQPMIGVQVKEWLTARPLSTNHIAASSGDLTRVGS